MAGGRAIPGPCPFREAVPGMKYYRYSTRRTVFPPRRPHERTPVTRSSRGPTVRPRLAEGSCRADRAGPATGPGPVPDLPGVDVTDPVRGGRFPDPGGRPRPVRRGARTYRSSLGALPDQAGQPLHRRGPRRRLRRRRLRGTCTTSGCTRTSCDTASPATSGGSRPSGCRPRGGQRPGRRHPWPGWAGTARSGGRRDGRSRGAVGHDAYRIAADLGHRLSQRADRLVDRARRSRRDGGGQPRARTSAAGPRRSWPRPSHLLATAPDHRPRPLHRRRRWVGAVAAGRFHPPTRRSPSPVAGGAWPSRRGSTATSRRNLFAGGSRSTSPTRSGRT